MSLRRLWLVTRTELLAQIRRPMIWILLLVLGFMIWGLANGSARISSGDASVGGTKSWVNSEFAIAMTLGILVALIYTFFVAVSAGMAVIQDDERKVGEILHATPLTSREYLWGKLLAVLIVFFGVLALQQLYSMVLYQLVPHDKMDEFIGPFRLAAYVVPALAFGLPTITFTALTAFAVGVRWRKPILVFVLPVAMILVCGFFLWNWSPSWLSPGWNKLLMALDPAGFRWLDETHLKIDRGVAFYNKSSIPFDALFWTSRLGIVGLGVAAFVWAERHFARAIRGEVSLGRRAGLAAAAGEAAASPAATIEAPAASLLRLRPLRALAMESGIPTFLGGTWQVARVELQELKNAAGLYLFVPLILLQTLGANWTALGPFGTLLLATPGTLAVRMMNTLTLLVCFLLLFYTVESHQREKNTGLAAIFDSTPISTGSILLGKSIANAVLGIAILVACFAGCAILMLIQGKVPIRLGPFLLTWGLLLVPTFLVWSCFVMAVIAITRNRYAAYAVGLLALILTGYLQFKDKMNWVFNWDLWSTLRWSDMGPFELSRGALVLNRILVLGLSAFLVVLAVRFHGRRESDPVRTFHRLRPRALFGSALRLAPFALVPIVVSLVLGTRIGNGFQSTPAKKKAHDYWKQNLATWKDAPEPQIADLDVKLELEPRKSWFKTEGKARLVNRHEFPLERFALTGGFHWTDPKWTLDGKEVKPEDRTRLFAFTPDPPIPPGGSVEIGFSYEGNFPKGYTRNGGGMAEFILPSGVVLTAFSTSFLPEIGYDEEIGIEEDKNEYEPKVYPDNFYVGPTPAAFGSGGALTARVEITGPAEYAYNSVGILESETVEGGRRKAIWKTDTPVRLLNVVGAKWTVRRGEGTAVFYHPDHTYNIDEMAAALDGARKYYSEWFREFPWKELKLSEFPSLATYAQGFATDITFSEAIGFLTREEKTGNAPFAITAHEAAHQWWGNMVLPGKGPGGNLLSEGMSHFSTILLIEQVKGLSQRIEFCKRIEERYGEDRQVDSEKPMVKIDGSKPGDTTVTYDKMGWVMWMMLQQIGRENILRGLHDFQSTYADNDDHPVLQDLVAFLRPYAPDPPAYDAFIQQWFREVHVAEYKLEDAKKTKTGDRWTATAKVTNAGTGTMPVTIAALKGERFDDEGTPEKDYQDARESLTLGPGESKEVTITCDFEPEKVEVDPDVVVLQLKRKYATAKL